MVGTLTFVGLFFSIILSTILPIVAIIVFAAKNKGKKLWSAWLIGAAGFVVFQLIIRVPILSLFAAQEWYTTFTTEHTIIYFAALAFTAGLFEVAGRYITAKLISKELTYKRAIAAGLGHGSIEAILIVGISLISYIVIGIMINQGGFETIIQQVEATGTDSSALYTLQDQLVSQPSILFFASGFERFLTIIAHTAMTTIVCYFVSKKKDFIGIVLCLAMHTALDFFGVILSSLGTDYLGNVLPQSTAYILTYIFLTAAAVFSIIILKKMKNGFVETAKVNSEEQ